MNNRIYILQSIIVFIIVKTIFYFIFKFITFLLLFHTLNVDMKLSHFSQMLMLENFLTQQENMALKSQFKA